MSKIQPEVTWEHKRNQRTTLVKCRKCGHRIVHQDPMVTEVIYNVRGAVKRFNYYHDTPECRPEKTWNF
jgi:DNA-directed RNA polymerase subunit RPC12/RpoP